MPKMACFSKFKFLFALKLNFNGGQFYKEIFNFSYFKKLENKIMVGNKIVEFEVIK